jgi:hypothetical protein
LVHQDIVHNKIARGRVMGKDKSKIFMYGLTLIVTPTIPREIQEKIGFCGGWYGGKSLRQLLNGIGK